MNMSEAIARVVVGENLSQDEMTEIMKLIICLLYTSDAADE